MEKSIQTETCKKKSFDPTVYNLKFNIKNVHTCKYEYLKLFINYQFKQAPHCTDLNVRYSASLLKSFEGLVHVLLWLCNWAKCLWRRSV